MYESQTYDKLLTRMLKKALSTNSNLDTREGSLIWLANAPAAVEFQNLYIALDTILKETFADTASRPYLILRAAERGLTPKAASAAVLQMQITPNTLTLDLNTRFSIGNLNYYVSANEGGGLYELTCETVGESGNDYPSKVIPIDYIEGLETCTITGLLIPGEDAEGTETFRKRYIADLNSQAFGGNKADYLEKINAIAGVGGVKVYRDWNGDLKPSELVPPATVKAWLDGLTGVSVAIKAWLNAVYTAAANNKLTVGGTVKVVIVDSEYRKPSDALIERVQTAVDPLQNSGEGVGIAPIGHVVKIEGVAEQTINLSFDLYYQAGYAWENVSDLVKESMDEYMTEIAESWANSDDALVVAISQIRDRLLAINGILSTANIKINGEAAGLTLDADTIPVLGTIEAGTIEIS